MSKRFGVYTREEFDAVGDRQKEYERSSGTTLMPGTPLLMRLDGRAFHTFTKGLTRPFDERLTALMQETTKILVRDLCPSIAYTQSDEISLVFPYTLQHGHDRRKYPSAPESIYGVEMPFGGRVQKLCSIVASIASVTFNKLLPEYLPGKVDALPMFDARIWTVPNLGLAHEYFLWRESDATRNSVSMAAHHHFPSAKLHGVNVKGKLDMLKAQGVNWNTYPASFKRGSYVRREQRSVLLSDEELARIPPKYRPDPGERVTRTVITVLNAPPLASPTPATSCSEATGRSLALDNLTQPIRRFNEPTQLPSRCGRNWLALSAVPIL